MFVKSDGFMTVDNLQYVLRNRN